MKTVPQHGLMMRSIYLLAPSVRLPDTDTMGLPLKYPCLCILGRQYNVGIQGAGVRINSQIVLLITPSWYALSV